MTFYADCLILWQSALQPHVVLSPMEAEIMQGVVAVKALRHLAYILNWIDGEKTKIEKPIPFFSNNNAAQFFVQQQSLPTKTKHY